MDQVKTCKRCGEEKPLSEFYKAPINRDGFRGKCKTCWGADTKRWKADNHNRVVSVRRANRNRARDNLLQAEYRRKRREAGKTRAHWERLKADPEFCKAHKARRKLHYAIQKGRVARGPCEVCGAFAEAHHVDYDKPYEVQWLCRLHHARRHYGAD